MHILGDTLGCQLTTQIECHRYKLAGSGRRHGLINHTGAAWVYGRSEKVQSYDQMKSGVNKHC